MNKITKENFEYSKVKNIIKNVPFIKVVKDEENLLIIQTLKVSPFRELFHSVREKGHKEDGVKWCFCIPKDNKSWGWFAEKSFKDFTKNGKNQQYIAFDFSKEYSLHNGCIVAFTVENNKITWAHILDNTLTEYVKECDERFKEGKEFCFTDDK
jgi:hypothetical protein